MYVRSRKSLWITIATTTLLAGLCMLWLTGCGGGSDSDAANISIQATDAPVSHELVSEATIWVNRIDIRSASAEEDEFINLYTGPAIEMSLLELTNGLTQELVSAEIPPGLYNQVRLYYSDASLTLTNGNVYTIADGTMNLTSQDVSGQKINIQPPLQVQDGISSTLLLDFDLTRTFRPIPSVDPMTATSYHIGPVIRAAVLSTTGEIAGTVTDAGTLAGVEVASVYVMAPGETDVANAIASSATDATGHYAIIGLEPGAYDVIAQLGERSATQAGAVVVLGNVTTVNLELPAEQAPET